MLKSPMFHSFILLHTCFIQTVIHEGQEITTLRKLQGHVVIKPQFSLFAKQLIQQYASIPVDGNT